MKIRSLSMKESLMKPLRHGLLLLALLPMGAFAAGGGATLQSANIDVGNTASLQRGARLFHNYCLGCHAVEYMRYSRVAEDLGLPPDLVQENLIFTGAQLGDRIENAMPAEASADWFGKAPPDLTLTARQRGADWVYTYLDSFYLDEASPTGVNNVVFPDVGMPHVLWPLQGWQAATFAPGEHGAEHGAFEGFQLVEAGAMTPGEYDGAIRDITAYMSYLAEPVQIQRQRLGLWVLAFIAVLGVLAYLLKQEYWKDIH